MNCRSVSQWNWRISPVQERHDREPAAEQKRLAPAKYVRIFQRTPTDAGPPETGGRSPERPQKRESGGRRSRQPSSEQHRHEPEHPEDPGMISDSVQAVTPALTAQQIQSS